MAKNKWELKLNDKVEDPYYELTNGQTTLIADCGFVGETDEDEDAIFKKVVDTLNESGIDFRSANALELEQHIKIMELQYELDSFKSEPKCGWKKGSPKEFKQHYAKVPSKLYDHISYNAIIIPKDIPDHWWAVGDGFAFDITSSEIVEYFDETGNSYNELHESVNKMKLALEKIIEINRQQAFDQYGDAEKAETWSCVIVAREALKKIIILVI